MAPTVQLAQDERATRWFRRVVPVAVFLAILLLLMMPGMVVEKPDGRARDDPSRHPLAHIPATEH